MPGPAKNTFMLLDIDTPQALEAARRGYVLETGRVVLADDTAALQQDSRVREAYLGG